MRGATYGDAVCHINTWHAIRLKWGKTDFTAVCVAHVLVTCLLSFKGKGGQMQNNACECMKVHQTTDRVALHKVLIGVLIIG